MVKSFQIAITLIFTSFFFFPFFFTFLPSVNTKMMVAAGGLILFLYNLSKRGKAVINKDFLILSLCALSVSFVSLLSMTINDTPDDSYLSYIVSMWVWLGAAYFVVNSISWVHGYVSVELVCFYLIGVGVAQCLLAVLIDQNVAVKTFIDSILAGEGFMGKNEDRLYGLGCALDVAGGRFAALLIMIAFLLPRMIEKEKSRINILFLLISFGIISVVGNIIGRTATIGLVIAIAYLLCILLKSSSYKKDVNRQLCKWLLAFFSFSIVFSILLYNSSLEWQEHFRFGFEGFFSLVETGHWEVHSNEMLKSHFIFPDNFKTWIIGDGRMAPTDIDPYYVGTYWKGFYMGSDVGYVRFIFYFGLIGLFAFSIFMFCAGLICYLKFWNYKNMFLMFVALNFIIWLKVSTDIFLIFAPFLIIQKMKNVAICKFYEYTVNFIDNNSCILKLNIHFHENYLLYSFHM